MGDKVWYEGSQLFTLNKSNNWQKDFVDLPEKDAGGNPYYYFVAETPVDGYTTSYDPSTNFTSNGSLTIKNTKKAAVPTNVRLNVQKTWSGATDAEKQEVTFDLMYRKVDRNQAEDFGAQATVKVDYKVLDKAGTTVSSGAKTLVKGGTYNWIASITPGNGGPSDYPTTATAAYTIGGTTQEYITTRTTANSEIPVKYTTTFTATADGTLVLTLNTTDNGTYRHTFNVSSLPETKVTPTPDPDQAASLMMAMDLSMGIMPIADATPAPVADGFYGSYKLNAGNGWALSFVDLPKQSPDGKYDYYYYVVEKNVPAGFAVSYSANNTAGIPGEGWLEITNTKLKEEIDIKVKKAWEKDASVTEAPNDAGSVEFTLIQVVKTATATTEKVRDTVKVEKKNGAFEHTFTNLPITNAERTEAYSYYVKETNVLKADGSKLNGYTPKYSNTEPIDKDGQTITVTNVRDTTVLSVLKQWKNPDGSSLIPPASMQVQIELYRRTENDATALWVDRITLPDANGKWEKLYTNLYAYDESGNRYIYFFKEVEISMDSGATWKAVKDSAFDVSYSAHGVSRGQLLVTNTAKQKNLTIQKAWQDAAGKSLAGTEAYLPDSISVRLEQKLTTDANWKRYGYEDYTVRKADGWKLDITGLPVYTTDGAGTIVYYEYRIVEQQQEGFLAPVYAPESVAANSTANTLTVTNKQEATSYKVRKVYAANSVTTPEVAVTLYQTITQGNTKVTKAYGSITLTGAETTPWTHTWQNLPQMGTLTDGPVSVTGPITYSVQEDVPVGFIAAYTTSGNETIITNTPTELRVTKKWMSLSSGQQTTVSDRTIYYQIMQQKVTQNGTLEGNPVVYQGKTHAMTSANGAWPTVKHLELPAYWTENGATGTYRYSVVETDQNGKETLATYEGNDVGVDTIHTITMVNTVTEISMRKLWVDDNNKAYVPGKDVEIKVQLKRFAKVPTTAATGETTQVRTEDAAFNARTDTTVTLFTKEDANGIRANKWYHTWSDLEAYGTLDGKQVQWYYYVEETEIPLGYMEKKDLAVNNLGITGEVTGQTIQIVNVPIQYTLPETGGSGTTLYTLTGLAMMFISLTALGYQTRSRKKQRGEG